MQLEIVVFFVTFLAICKGFNVTNSENVNDSNELELPKNLSRTTISRLHSNKYFTAIMSNLGMNGFKIIGKFDEEERKKFISCMMIQTNKKKSTQPPIGNCIVRSRKRIKARTSTELRKASQKNKIQKINDKVRGRFWSNFLNNVNGTRKSNNIKDLRMKSSTNETEVQVMNLRHQYLTQKFTQKVTQNFTQSIIQRLNQGLKIYRLTSSGKPKFVPLDATIINEENNNTS